MRGREREGASLGMHRTIMSREKLRTLRKCGRRSSGFLSPPLIFVKRTWPPFRDVAAGTFKELLFCDVAVLRGKGVKKEREGS